MFSVRMNNNCDNIEELADRQIDIRFYAYIYPTAYP